MFGHLSLFPGQPMRIYEVPDLDPAKWLMQIKKNGHRAIVRCPASGKVELFSRHGEPLTAAKRLDWQWLAELFHPPFVFDGELVGPRQAGSETTLHIWDCALMGGHSWLAMRYNERLGYLAEHWIEKKKDLQGGVGPRAYLLPIEAPPLRSEWQALWDTLTDPDGPDEGIVFKRYDVPLRWHRRPEVKDPDQLKLRRKG